MSLLSIPPEIRLLILRHLNDSTGLAGLSRSCRSFHELVEKNLYSEFVDVNRETLPLFLRTLMEKPKLAEHIKTLDLREPEIRQWTRVQSEYTAARFEWSKLAPLLEDYYINTNKLSEDYYFNINKLSEYNRVVCDLGPHGVRLEAVDHIACLEENYNWDFLVSTLLLCVPNLEQLTMTPPTHQYDAMEALETAAYLQSWEFAHRVSQKSPYSLSKLKEISMVMETSSITSKVIDTIYPVMQMRSLQTFSCEGMKLPWPYSSGLFAWRSLTLIECSIMERDLGNILSKSFQLEHFHSNAVQYGLDEDPQPWILWRSLLKVSNTLKRLTLIDEWLIDGDNGGKRRNNIPLPSLAGFTQLQTLRISSHMLVGSKILRDLDNNKRPPEELNGMDLEVVAKDFALRDLPASIVDFTVERADEGILKLLKELDFELLPNLKSVRVKFDKSLSARMGKFSRLPVKGLDDWKGVEKVFEEKGVLLMWN